VAARAETASASVPARFLSGVVSIHFSSSTGFKARPRLF
jgi:hypothetical protein